jgi:hypothetical protein
MFSRERMLLALLGEETAGPTTLRELTLHIH